MIEVPNPGEAPHRDEPSTPRVIQGSTRSLIVPVNAASESLLVTRNSRDERLLIHEDDLILPNKKALDTNYFVEVERDTPCFYPKLEALVEAGLINMSCTVTTKNAEWRIRAKLARYKRLLGEEFDDWIKDMTKLARAFMQFAGVPKAEVRLTSSYPSQGQHEFNGQDLHVDSSGLRLMCCYVGKGTEWVRRSAVDVQRFYQFLRTGQPREFLNPETAIEHFARGNYALVRGEKPIGIGGGFIHRTPHHSGRRLFMTIDPITDTPTVMDTLMDKASTLLERFPLLRV